MKEVPHSLLSTDRIGKIRELLQSVNTLNGNIAEVGCYKGGIGHYLNLHSNGKEVYLFDTFEGIPMQGESDPHKVGDFSDTSFEKLKEYFAENSNVKVVKGIFPESAKGVIGENESFCFVHLDADQYKSTFDSLSFFYDKIVKGGIIVFDDVNWLKGVDEAIHDFFENKNEKLRHSVLNQGFIIKE